MKIKNILVENFRPYYGKQSIDFSDDDRNITIIFGDNGGGKTSLYRALLFALFGDVHIEQDDKDSGIRLVNSKALLENPGQPVDAISQVEFEHNGYYYKVKRIMSGVLHGDNQMEQFKSASLTVTDPSGNTIPEPITNVDHINSRINSIINEKMQSFFFFDGEQIDTLTTTQSSKRDSVKAAIHTVTQLDELNKVQRTLKRVIRNIDNQLSKNSKSHIIKQKIEQKEEKEKYLDSLVYQVKSWEADIEDKVSSINQLNAKLEQNKEAEILNVKIQLIESELNNINEKYDADANQIMKTLINKSPLTLLEDYQENIETYLQTRYESETSVVPLPLLTKSILEETCACCGIKLSDHIDALQHLNNQKNSYKHNNLNEFTSVLLSHYNDSKIDNIREVILDYLKREHSLRENINLKNNELEIEENKLNEYAVTKTELIDLMEKQTEISSELDQLKIQRGVYENKIETTKKEVEDINKEIKSLAKEQESLEVLLLRRDAAEAISKSLEHALVKYNDKMQAVLTEKTTTIFKTLIDKRDKDLISKININEKYEIDILDKNGIIFTQDISQGQRKIAAISFIMALTQLGTGKDDTIPYPFFMDTPFSNFDLDHRLSLINKIPNLISQWILLLTDTEMTPVEEKEFRKTKKVGKWYKINRIETFHAEIVEHSEESEINR